MAVEEIFAPVGAVFGVCVLDVDAHVGREDLSGQKNEKTGAEIAAGGFDGFALLVLLSAWCRLLMCRATEQLTLLPASANALTRTPTVRMITLVT